MASRTHRFVALPVLWLVSILGGCADRPPPLDDQTRRVVPLPACIAPLPPRRSESIGTMRILREEQIWKLLFPTFDVDNRLLPRDAVACTHAPVLDDPSLRGGTSVRGWPFHEDDGDVEFGSGGDRIKVVWLKIFKWPDGSVGGPIALVRANERFADLFAVGALRGPPERVKLGTERVGDDIVLVAEQDNCTGRKSTANCESRLTILLASHGELSKAAELSSERVEHFASPEKNATGVLEYRLTTVFDYKPDGIHLTEQILVTDEAGRSLRKAEVVRLFALNDVQGKLTTLDPPLWDTFVSPDDKPAKPAPPSPHDAHEAHDAGRGPRR
jgi:hypothetical protein